MEIRLLLAGSPGSPIFEVGDRLADFHNVDFFTIEYSPEDQDSYFEDSIPQIDLDVGDFKSGSESQHLDRDIKSIIKEKSIDRAEPGIFSCKDFYLDEKDKFEIFQIKNGIISTEMADNVLCQWATHVVFFEAEEELAISWFSKRLKCNTCDATFHLEERPPNYPNICDRCGSDLYRMQKDNPKEIKKQFKNFRNSFWKFKELAKKSCKYTTINMDKFKNVQSIIKHIDLFVFPR